MAHAMASHIHKKVDHAMLTTIRQLLSNGDLGQYLRRTPTEQLYEMQYNAHAQHDSLGHMVELIDAELASRDAKRQRGGA